MTLLRDRRAAAFAAMALAVLLVEWAVSHTRAFERRGLVPSAVLVDLVVTMPLLFVAVVLRPAKRPWLEAAPVFAVGAIVAAVLLHGRAETRALVRIAGALAELAVLAHLAVRLRAARRELRGAAEDDLLLRAYAISDPVLRLLAAELVVLAYALVGPFRPRPRGRESFGVTETSGIGAVLFALGLVVVMEGIVVHLVLRSACPRAAWLLAALDAYALVWLLAAFQAARLRPILVTEERLLVRVSLLWTVDVPRASIARVAPLADAPRGPGVLRAALGTAPVLLVTLTAPVIARGPLGLERTVTRIALHVDEPERLVAALLEARLEGVRSRT